MSMVLILKMKLALRYFKKIYNLNQINNFDIIIDDGSHNLSDILLE